MRFWFGSEVYEGDANIVVLELRNKNMIPSAHTCFNRLDMHKDWLDDYDSEDEDHKKQRDGRKKLFLEYTEIKKYSE
jgi:hypothetical protein